MPKKPLASSDVADKFMLRMPEGMRDRIAAEAEKSKRSMNAEIVARLEASFRGGVTEERLNKAAEDVLKRMREMMVAENDRLKKEPNE